MSSTLLVYDDDPDVLDVVSTVAEEVGFDTAGTSTNDEFWLCYGQGQPAAIVLDLDVPGTNGIDLLGELADRKCTAPILVMSGYHREILNCARRLGGSYGLKVRDVIPKPFDIDDLKEKLEGLV
jgi:DNA-binding response OmpR family regulator